MTSVSAARGLGIVGSMSDPELIVEHCWRSSPGNVQRAREAARDVLHRYAAAEADMVVLAVGEACANAVEHGSPRGDASEFSLRCFVSPDRSALVFEVEDEGCEFRLTGLPFAELPDQYSEHGRGLFLINAIMDEVALRSTPHGLSVRMSKHLCGDISRV